MRGNYIHGAEASPHRHGILVGCGLAFDTAIPTDTFMHNWQGGFLMYDPDPGKLGYVEVFASTRLCCLASQRMIKINLSHRWSQAFEYPKPNPDQGGRVWANLDEPE